MIFIQHLFSVFFLSPLIWTIKLWRAVVGAADRRSSISGNRRSRSGLWGGDEQTGFAHSLDLSGALCTSYGG